MNPVFTILTVCTGNICRSPLAEQLLALQLSDLGDLVRVHSAGTRALVGAPMSEKSQQIARALGVETPESHEPRRLTEDILAESDLILALDRDHKKSIVELSPRVTKRVFTLREFARLAAATTDEDLALDVRSAQPSQRLREAVTAVGLTRGLIPPLSDPTEADVIDPYKQSDTVYARSTAEIVPAVDATVALLQRALRLIC